MSNLIPLFLRANEIDGDGDMAPVTDATAYFFESGSTTPLTVYEDAGLTTPRGTSVAADANGIFPKCYTDESTVKLDIRDGEGTSLDGHPIDEYPVFAASDNAASSISASPQTGNAGTTVAAQLNNNTERGNRFDNAAGLPTASGSMGSYAIASPYTITAYAVRQEYEFIANHTNVGGGSDSLNVDAVGAVTLKKYEGSTTKADLAAGDIAAGDKVRVKYDGSHFAVVSPLNAGEETKGIVEAATTAEMTAGTADKFPDAAKVKAHTDALPITDFIATELLTTDESEVAQTGLSGYKAIEFMVAGQASGSGLSIQVRASGGTWRTIFSGFSPTSATAFVGFGAIKNFNNDDGTEYRHGWFHIAEQVGNSMDRSDAVIQGEDNGVTKTFFAAYDEVWDEIRLLSGGTIEGSSADNATSLDTWGY